MTLRYVSGPTTEPVTLAQAKAHLRVDNDAEDSLISALISTARGLAETKLRRALGAQTWTRTLDAFPANAIELGMPPVQSITSVVYIDAAGDEQTLSTSDYILDNIQSPGWVLPSDSLGAWPSTASTVNAVTVTFVTGWAADAVPQEVKQYILMHVASMFDRRDAVSDVGNNAGYLPFVERLLDRWVVY